MEIKIFAEGDKTIVSTDTGIRVECADMNEAAVYARGLQEGYNAAARKLGHCHGWKHG